MHSAPPSSAVPPPALIRTTTPALSGPDLAWRRAAPGGAPEQHDRLCAEAAALHAIELGPPPGATLPPPEKLRVVAWNTEYLKHVERSADRLRALEPDLVLLSEVDLGMARSGNRHTAADLARLLNMTWVFAAEFVELGSADTGQERGAQDAHGLHGNAVLSRLPLLDPVLIRFASDGRWFTGRLKGERRLGGRIALAARVATRRGPVGLAATHFESYGDPNERAAAMRTLLDTLDGIDPALPWLVGGDLNTNTVSLAQRLEPGWRQRVAAEAPGRLLDPVSYEPLFREAEARGYGWRSANTPNVATQRLHEDEPERPLGRLDWFFARGLACTDPATIPALDRTGRILSDHEPIAVTVERRQPG